MRSRLAAIRELASARTRDALTHVVSIGDVGSEPPFGFEKIARRLRLEFLDTSSDVPGGPQPGHVEELLAFFGTVQADSTVLVHCEAGISRSTAAGIILLATFLEPGREHEAVDAVVKSVVFAMPNPRLIRFGDEALERRGALVAAVEAVPLTTPF